LASLQTSVYPVSDSEFAPDSYYQVIDPVKQEDDSKPENSQKKQANPASREPGTLTETTPKPTTGIFKRTTDDR
jgi:hypothetical protein